MAGITRSPTARDNLLRRLTDITRTSSVRTAEKRAAKLRAAVAALKTFPEVGSPVEDFPVPGLREHPVGPYRVNYRYDGTACLILAIPRTEQDLGRVLDPENLP